MKNIILIINIKNPNRPDRDAMYNLSIESWKRWADNNNCQVICLGEPIVPIEDMTPIIQRHYVFELLDGNGIDYNQVLLVDADTIVHPGCANFFDETDYKFCGVHNDGDYDWVCRSIENYEYAFYNTDIVEPSHVWNYINTGFMITNREYRQFHVQVIDFYLKNRHKIQDLQTKYGVGTDQPLVNMMLRHSQIDYKILPYIYNMQDLHRKNILDERMLFTQIPGVYHFNAIPGGVDKTNYWIQKTFNYLYD